eukprot:Mycagemm_TRINITY_DN4249_c0_g2::TRINITY_DN4249_c0_g2_i1::g.2949::m.2949 type:complete len:135 gc:universal TRINITY_DN4249_c0_g2_i1:40-444(+)
MQPPPLASLPEPFGAASTATPSVEMVLDVGLAEMILRPTRSWIPSSRTSNAFSTFVASSALVSRKVILFFCANSAARCVSTCRWFFRSLLLPISSRKMLGSAYCDTSFSQLLSTLANESSDVISYTIIQPAAPW